ncbi:MAG TPA: sigma-70 family RNA polymerase sigma factor [Anaerolineales bacterium]|nr:sigma-70 family RNA polymerase sigma factor [Anaerolineales bacterium]
MLDISNEEKHLAAARQGNAQHFSELTEPYRRELQVHCYRILGSLHEAEDMVQETFFKAWKHIGNYEGRASFRSWLYKIATNTCLDYLDSKRSRGLHPPRRQLPFQSFPASDPQTILPPSTELTWLEPLPDEWLVDSSAVDPESYFSETESVSLSFLTALQLLPPRQRAVLILRDVLDFSASETAEVLELTLSSVNSLLHRARKALAENYRSPVVVNPRTDKKTQWLLDRYVRAWKSADVDGLVALLKRDAIIAMPPSPSWYQGRAAIAKFTAMSVFGIGGMFPGKARNRWQLLPTRANGASAFVLYQRDEQNHYQAFGLQILILQSGKISQIINFIDPGLPAKFGFPDELK